MTFLQIPDVRLKKKQRLNKKRKKKHIRLKTKYRLDSNKKHDIDVPIILAGWEELDSVEYTWGDGDLILKFESESAVVVDLAGDIVADIVVGDVAGEVVEIFDC